MRTHFSRIHLHLPFRSGGGLLLWLLDVTSEPNTWNQFARLRRGYWFSQCVYTWKISLFNSACGWFLPHAALSQADWVRHMSSLYWSLQRRLQILKNLKKSLTGLHVTLNKKDYMCFLEKVWLGDFFFLSICLFWGRMLLGEKFLCILYRIKTKAVIDKTPNIGHLYSCLLNNKSSTE